MIISKIRNKHNNKLSEKQMKTLINTLSNKIKEAGFITEVKKENGSRLKLSIHKKGAILDISKRPYNIRHSSYSKERRTSCMSWECHVEYNNLLNKILDTLEIKAQVYNSMFLIRDGLEKYDEKYWYKTRPHYYIKNILNGYYIEKGGK